MSGRGFRHKIGRRSGGAGLQRPPQEKVISKMRNSYNGVPVPRDGQPIQFDPKTEEFKVPDRPIIPFIEGDGTGRDIWKASQQVFDAAVAKSCAGTGKRRVVWL